MPQEMGTQDEPGTNQVIDRTEKYRKQKYTGRSEQQAPLHLAALVVVPTQNDN